jgi:hypothetical protein
MVASDDLRAADPFGRLLLKQRKLLKEREKLISQIQAMPGFDSFLTFPSFDTLRSAASSGPVIIINHSFWRCDILILLHDTSPSLITTPNDFHGRASALHEKLLGSRQKHGLDSSHYDQTLGFVLAELYSFIGKPVIDRLRQLQYTRIVSHLVVPDIHLLFPSSTCYGSNPIRWRRDSLFHGPLHLFIYPIALCTDTISLSRFRFAIVGPTLLTCL